MARKPHDYLGLAGDAVLRKSLTSFWTGGTEDVLFSDVVTKINRKEVAQERILVVTNKALYNLNKSKKIKRRIDLTKVAACTLSTISDEFVVHVPSEYDYRFKAPRKAEAVDVLVTARAGVDGHKLQVQLSSQIELKDVTITRTKAPVAGAASAPTAAGSPPAPAARVSVTTPSSSAAAAASASSDPPPPAAAPSTMTRGFSMSTSVGELGPIEEADEDSEGKWRAKQHANALLMHARGGGMRIPAAPALPPTGMVTHHHHFAMSTQAHMYGSSTVHSSNPALAAAAAAAMHQAAVPSMGLGYYTYHPAPGAMPVVMSPVDAHSHAAVTAAAGMAAAYAGEVSHTYGYVPSPSAPSRAATATPTSSAGRGGGAAAGARSSPASGIRASPISYGASAASFLASGASLASRHNSRSHVAAVTGTGAVNTASVHHSMPRAASHDPAAFEFSHNPLASAGSPARFEAGAAAAHMSHLSSALDARLAKAEAAAAAGRTGAPRPPVMPAAPPPLNKQSQRFATAYQMLAPTGGQAGDDSDGDPAPAGAVASNARPRGASTTQGTIPASGVRSRSSTYDPYEAELGMASAGTSFDRDSGLLNGGLSREGSLEFDRRAINAALHGSPTKQVVSMSPGLGSGPGGAPMPLRFTGALAQLHGHNTGGALSAAAHAAAAAAAAAQRPASVAGPRAGAVSAGRSASALSDGLGYVDEEEEFDDDGFTAPAPGEHGDEQMASSASPTAARMALHTAISPADEMSALDTSLTHTAAAPAPYVPPSSSVLSTSRPGSAGSLARALRGQHRMSPTPGMALHAASGSPRTRTPVAVTGWSKTYTPVGLDSFEMLRLLGRGSYGKVVLVRKKDTGEVLAMKILNKATLVARNQVDHTNAERAILESIDHPFLIKLRYAFQTPSKLYFVLPYLRGGEVFFHLKQKRRFDEELACFYTAEILLAIGHMHALGIIYRDIKPENVLLDDDGHIKLTDFGLAKVLEAPTDTTRTFCGTPEYLAPEVVNGQPHDKGVDWWGLGIILWEFLTGLPPFFSSNVQHVYDMIRSQPIVFPPYISARARSLLQQLLERDPRRRLGNRPEDDDANAIKAHPFFEGMDWDALVERRMPPPWRPNVRRDRDADVSNFDREFTSEVITDSVGSTSALGGVSVPRFDGFSYQAPSQIASVSPHALLTTSPGPGISM